MRQTPRNLRSHASRGIGTLIGNGWLRESPRVPSSPHWPGKWDVRGKSALRKCMFMPVPDEVRHMMGPVSPAAMQPYPPRPAQPEPEIILHRRNPQKDAREFPAYVPGGAIDPRAAAAHARAMHVHDAQRAAAHAAEKAPAQWWEDPVALGSLLILFPPVGLAAVWASKRYSSDARWALTVMTALTMCLMSAILIAALAMR